MSVRFGVAGTAYWAREVHVRGLMARPDVELVGIWGRDVEATRDMASATGVRSFATFDEMLAAVDVVSIAVAPEAQPALACAAARTGKHLLLEKPLALSVETAASTADAIAKARVASVVFFMRRFVPIIERSIHEASHRRWKTASVRVHSAVLSSSTPFTSSRWRQQVGAELWDIGPHVLSILLPVLGPVLRIMAEQEPDGISRFQTVHEGGATADVSLTLRAPPSDAGIVYRFDGDAGTLTLPEPTIARPEALSEAAGDLVRMIAGRETAHRCDAAFGLEVVRVLEAAQLSSERRQPVDMK
jgi:predicted dehydrogenase